VIKQWPSLASLLPLHRKLLWILSTAFKHQGEDPVQWQCGIINKIEVNNNNNNNNITFFPKQVGVSYVVVVASWGKLEMKPKRNKFKIQAH